MNSLPADAVVTRAQIAKAWGVSEKMVAEKFPAFRLGHKTVRYHVGTVIEWAKRENGFAKAPMK